MPAKRSLYFTLNAARHDKHIRHPWVIVRAIVAVVVLMTNLIATAPGEQAHAASIPANTTTPVILIHGFQPRTAPSPLGPTTDCKAYFEGPSGGVKTYLQETHSINNAQVTWSGPIHYVGYYNNDAFSPDNCDVDLRQQASHCTSYYAGNDGTNQEDIRHLGCEFAWYLWTNYSSKHQTVQIVAHSMGGLVMRWALYAAQFDNRLPHDLLVQNIVTFDTPHGGVPPGFALFACGGCVQGAQMFQGSPFMNELYAGSDHNGAHYSAQSPQSASIGTTWTMMGNLCLRQNPLTSAKTTYMAGGYKVIFSSPCYGHKGFMYDWGPGNNTDPNAASANHGDTEDASVRFCDLCDIGVVNWRTWDRAPHALRRMLLALINEPPQEPTGPGPVPPPEPAPTPTPNGPAFAASFVTDTTGTLKLNPNTQSPRFTATFKNTGYETWQPESVFLAAYSPKSNAIVRTAWCNPSDANYIGGCGHDPTVMKLSQACAPQAECTFTYSVRTPGDFSDVMMLYWMVVHLDALGTYEMLDGTTNDEHYLVAPGNTPGGGIAPGQYHAQWVSDSYGGHALTGLTLDSGQVSDKITVTFANTGSADWPQGTEVVLALWDGTSDGPPTGTNFCHDVPNDWLSCVPGIAGWIGYGAVHPGQNGTFEFQIQAPFTQTNSDATLSFRPALHTANGYQWINQANGQRTYEYFTVHVNGKPRVCGQTTPGGIAQPSCVAG